MKLLLSCLLMVGTLLAQNDANNIMQAYQRANAIADLSSQLTYTNVSKTGRTQERSLEQYMRKNENGDNCYNLLLNFTAPRDVAGTSTLTLQYGNKPDDQWLYLPVLRTSKRISASKKSDRFMGTEMTYEDISTYLSEPLAHHDYQWLGDATINDYQVHKILATPQAGWATQYSKRILWIDQASKLMIRTEFYDKKGLLLKIFTASDLRTVGNSGFLRAHRIEVVNEQSGNRTTVNYHDFHINEGVDAGLFSKTYLETK